MIDRLNDKMIIFGKYAYDQTVISLNIHILHEFCNRGIWFSYKGCGIGIIPKD